MYLILLEATLDHQGSCLFHFLQRHEVVQVLVVNVGTGKKAGGVNAPGYDHPFSLFQACGTRNELRSLPSPANSEAMPGETRFF